MGDIARGEIARSMLMRPVGLLPGAAERAQTTPEMMSHAVDLTKIPRIVKAAQTFQSTSADGAAVVTSRAASDGAAVVTSRATSTSVAKGVVLDEARADMPWGMVCTTSVISDQPLSRATSISVATGVWC